jgi:hypothetical protein
MATARTTAKATAQTVQWLKRSNGLRCAGGVAGPSAALRFAQDDEFVLFEGEQKQQQQKKQIPCGDDKPEKQRQL